MAITAFPFDTQDTSEADFSRLMGEAVDDGIVGSFGGTGFQVSAGAGMTIVAAAGVAILRGFMGYTTGTEGPVSVAIGDQSYPRIDRAILRLDRTANNMIFTVKQGAPSPNPSPPALTRTDTGIYELPLARLNIPPGAETMLSGWIVDERPFVGSTVGSWSNDSRPEAPRRFKLGRNTTLGRWEYYDGEWVSLIPSTVQNATRWNGYNLIVSPTEPAPQPNAIWIQPL